MKLVIRQYLAALGERNELDAVLPDLLSQMGMNVFSRPGRGTRQYGVDVAAVGRLEGNEEAVYLFSVKPGDLRRTDWNSDSVQSLRPSLDEIRDTYIQTHLPAEHRDKPINICICVGGDIREDVRLNIESYTKNNTTDQVQYLQWNGDRLASLIESHFLREELLPEGARSKLRKSLALLDEPDASYNHFASLVHSILNGDISTPAKKVLAVRQLGICIWILFAWARDTGNLESAYRSAELLLLCSWQIVRDHAEKKGKHASAIRATYFSILSTYQQIGVQFVNKCVFPHSHKFHGLSDAVHGSSSIDVNLKLFDLLGRTALLGFWMYVQGSHADDGSEEQEAYIAFAQNASGALKDLISNNPALSLPIKDDQCIDIALAVLLLELTEDQESIGNWLHELMNRAIFAYRFRKPFPCNLESYSELIEHPLGNDEYRERVTTGSILYPFVAIVAAAYENADLYRLVSEFKRDDLEHCNLQYWYPDDATEEFLYSNSGLHGATLSEIAVHAPAPELLKQVFGECDHMPQFKNLSAVKFGLLPLVLTACRHYRLPVPLHVFKPSEASSDESNVSEKDAKDEGGNA